ncbi:MAG TPA: UbiA family prenyltransferase [Vicinamibacterales bacterium]|jgi:4-hydroxybenzoate polyprenyltransferase|nr:UbiA family prenyltransferase [Vicinamibacterales bacterium]
MSTVQQRHQSPSRPTDALPPLIAILRPHQWLKNLLVFIPAVAAHRIDWTTGRSAMLAFVSLSLCASGGYIVNDLLDVDADRAHPRKRFRPLASGRLPIRSAIALVIATWGIGFLISATTLPVAFVWTLAIYIAGTVAYSIWLKREPSLDVVVLAGLYVLRIIAGGAATAIPVSTWLLAFTLFMCLSLALMKRFIEVHAQPTAVGPASSRRGYRADDAQWLHSAGLAAAYLSVVILAIYVNNAAVTLLYTHSDRLLLVCPLLLYWSTRTWLRAHRRRAHDDPVLLVALDPVTYVLLAICVIIVAAAV